MLSVGLSVGELTQISRQTRVVGLLPIQRVFGLHQATTYYSVRISRALSFTTLQLTVLHNARKEQP